ncbi:hypothetical protein REH81_19220, partial [Vibrio rotiferianus]
TTTTDNESGFTFASTLNFDLNAKTQEIRKDSERLKEHELHEWLRKYSRYQCIEFSNYQIEQNLYKLKDKSVALSMDRQHYLVNWNDKHVRMPTKIVNTTTTDNESGFTFASTLNFDLNAKTQEIRKDSERLKEHELHEWLRKYSRYLTRSWLI